MTATDNLLLGDSLPMRRLRAAVRKIARRAEPALICGPTGSGKELVANALHRESGRRGRLVAFNVCALPDTMIEDLLFGHVRGAFTGAATDSPGYLLEADGGTAFFDEVSGLGVGAQAKLLRAIETGVFRPVGGRSDRRSDFRVVAAVNEPIASLLADGRLREDLLHRLSTFVLDVPPLASRVEDIDPLVTHFIRQAVMAGGGGARLSSSAMRVLRSYDWPGNVRELRNVIVGVTALAEGDEVTGQDVIEALEARRGRAMPTTREEHQRGQLLELLVRYSWDTSRVARELAVDRATVYRRMAALGIGRRSDDDVCRSRRKERQEACDDLRTTQAGASDSEMRVGAKHDERGACEGETAMA